MIKHKYFYLAMLVPIALMQAGIYKDYWGDFAENAWSVHVHYWLATTWYLFLIVQPWLYARGDMATHRTLGIIGMFMAGGVGWGALNMLHRDMVSATVSASHPEQFGPFKPWFFYGVAVVELVMILGFVFAVVQAILNRKRLEDHAWWLISTVFIIMMPALGRGLQAAFSTYAAAPDMLVMTPIYVSLAIIIGLLLAGAVWLGKLLHPATWLAVGVNAFSFLLEPLGRSEAVQRTLIALIKG